MDAQAHQKSQQKTPLHACHGCVSASKKQTKTKGNLESHSEKLHNLIAK
jgi:hypothetical protein